MSFARVLLSTSISVPGVVRVGIGMDVFDGDRRPLGSVRERLFVLVRLPLEDVMRSLIAAVFVALVAIRRGVCPSLSSASMIAPFPRRSATVFISFGLEQAIWRGVCPSPFLVLTLAPYAMRNISAVVAPNWTCRKIGVSPAWFFRLTTALVNSMFF